MRELFVSALAAGSTVLTLMTLETTLTLGKRLWNNPVPTARHIMSFVLEVMSSHDLGSSAGARRTVPASL